MPGAAERRNASSADPPADPRRGPDAASGASRTDWADGLPAAGVPRGCDRLLDPGDGRRILEPRGTLDAGHHPLEELGGLDDLEIVETQTNSPAGIERAVERVGRPAELDRPARLHRRPGVATEIAKLVHSLE